MKLLSLLERENLLLSIVRVVLALEIQVIFNG